MLCEGEIIFDGAPSEIPTRVELLGMNIPEYMPPIDYLMKAIDKEEIKVEYEKLHSKVSKHDPKVIDNLYKERIKQLQMMEKKTNYFRKKTMISTHRISFKNRSSMIEPENEEPPPDKELRRQLIQSDMLEGETPLEYQARTTHLKLPLLKQIYLLTKINVQSYYRKLSTYIVISLQILVMTGLVIAIYNDLEDPETDTLAAIQNRRGFLFLVVGVSIQIGLNSTLLNFLSKKKQIIKDQDSRIYDLLPYFIAETSYGLPKEVFVASINSILYFYVIGLSKDPNAFKNLNYFTLYFVFGGEIMGKTFSLILSTIGNNIEEIASLVPLIIVPMFFFAGFLADVRHMLLPPQIISYISPLRFSYQGLILVEFQNKAKYTDSCVAPMPCPDDPERDCPVPLPPSQREVCDPSVIFNFYEDDIMLNLGILILLFFFYNVIAFVLLKLKTSSGKMKYKKNENFREQFTRVEDNFESPKQSKLDPLVQKKYIKDKMRESREKKESQLSRDPEEAPKGEA